MQQIWLNEIVRRHWQYRIKFDFSVEYRQTIHFIDDQMKTISAGRKLWLVDDSKSKAKIWFVPLTKLHDVYDKLFIENFTQRILWIVQ